MAKKPPNNEQPANDRAAFDEAFNEAWAATEQIIAADPQRRGDPTLPIFQLAAKEKLERCRQAFEAGDRYALMLAIRVCANRDLPMPDWVARAYIRAYDTVNGARAKSWDDAFGAPYPKGSHIAAIEKRRKLRFAVFNRVNDIRARDPGVPIDEALFERVGEEFGIKKTLTAELYYQAKAQARIGG